MTGRKTRIRGAVERDVNFVQQTPFHYFLRFRTTNGPPKIPVRKSALPLLKGVKTSSKQGLPGPPQSLGTRRTTGSSRLSTIRSAILPTVCVNARRYATSCSRQVASPVLATLS